jgi:hypothetical protein
MIHHLSCSRIFRELDFDIRSWIEKTRLTASNRGWAAIQHDPVSLNSNASRLLVEINMLFIMVLHITSVSWAS